METLGPSGPVLRDRLSRRWHVLLTLALLGLAASGAYIVGPALRLPRGAPLEVAAGWNGETAQALSSADAATSSESARENAQNSRAESARALFLRAEKKGVQPGEAQRLLTALIAGYADTSWAERAKVRLGELAGPDDRKIEAESVYQCVAEQVRILTEWGDYQGAEALCAGYLAGRPPAEYAAKVPRLRVDIQRESDRELQQFMQEVHQLVTKREYALARELIVAGQDIFRDERSKAQLAEQLQAVALAERDAAEAAESDELLLAQESKTRAICELCVKGAYDDAVQLAQELARTAARLRLEDLAALAKALEQSVGVERSFRDELVARINKSPRRGGEMQILSQIRGTIVAATKEKVTVEMGRGATTAVAWAAVPPENTIAIALAQVERSRPSNPAPEAADRFAVGVLAAHRRLFSLMERLFALVQPRTPAQEDMIRQMRRLAVILKPAGE
ncbi:MAG: hypothetical protein ABSE73_11675 [Planctomycetota bacterium]